MERTIKIVLICSLLGFYSTKDVKSQILVGADYGIEFSSLSDEFHSRSGAQISASYFVHQSIELRLTLGYFNKGLVDSSFNKLANWSAMSQSFSANYYFFVSDFRPYVGLGVGHYNNKINDENLLGYFNDNSITVLPEVGFLATISPRVKLNVGARYNIIFDSENSTQFFIGLKIPLSAQ